LRPYIEAGFDDVYISLMGGPLAPTSVDGFFEFDAALARFRELAG
jgi:hypothetical protein